MKICFVRRGVTGDQNKTHKAYLEELPQRILLVRSTPEQQDFGVYVTFGRNLRNMSRRRLAQETDLEPKDILFIEKGLLRTEELTDEVRTRVEQALGFSYEKFQMLPQQKKEAIREGWGPITHPEQGGNVFQKLTRITTFWVLTSTRFIDIVIP